MTEPDEDDGWSSVTGFGDAFEDQVNVKTGERRHRPFARVSFFAGSLPAPGVECVWIAGPSPIARKVDERTGEGLP